jgi:hypothetical protein
VGFETAGTVYRDGPVALSGVCCHSMLGANYRGGAAMVGVQEYYWTDAAFARRQQRCIELSQVFRILVYGELTLWYFQATTCDALLCEHADDLFGCSLSLAEA